jgi:hypothetical protein
VHARVETRFQHDRRAPAAHHLGLDHRVLKPRRQLTQLLENLSGSVGIAVEPGRLGNEATVRDAREHRPLELRRLAQLLGRARDHHGRRADLAQPHQRGAHLIERAEAPVVPAAQQVQLDPVQVGGLSPRLAKLGGHRIDRLSQIGHVTAEQRRGLSHRPIEPAHQLLVEWPGHSGSPAVIRS